MIILIRQNNCQATCEDESAIWTEEIPEKCHLNLNYNEEDACVSAIIGDWSEETCKININYNDMNNCKKANGDWNLSAKTCTITLENISHDDCISKTPAFTKDDGICSTPYVNTDYKDKIKCVDNGGEWEVSKWKKLKPNETENNKLWR